MPTRPTASTSATPARTPIPEPHEQRRQEGLVGALDKLRASLDAIRSNLDASNAHVGGINARFGANLSGLGSVQGLVGSIKQAFDQASGSFVDAMSRTQRAWKANIGDGRAAWSASVDTFRTAFNATASGVASRFKQAFDATATAGRAFNATRQAAVAAARQASTPVADSFRAARNFAADFASGWKHAAPGGIPVGGFGAAWGQAIGLGWQGIRAGAARSVARGRRALGRARKSAWGGVKWARSRRTSVARAFRTGAKAVAARASNLGRFGRAWAGQANAFGRRAAASLARRAGGFGRGAAALGRGAFGRARAAWTQARRAYGKTGSVAAAFKAGAQGLLGARAVAGLGQLVVATQAFAGAMKTVRASFEEANDANRRFARFGGQTGLAFNQLAIGDHLRDFRLARDNDSGAAMLARLTNRSRDIAVSFEDLKLGASNRVNGAGAVLWNGVMEPVSWVADQFRKAADWADPKQDMLAGMAAAPFSALAGLKAFGGSLYSNGLDTKAAMDAAAKAIEDKQNAQLAGKPLALDPWAEWAMQQVNMPPINPAGPIVP